MGAEGRREDPAAPGAPAPGAPAPAPAASGPPELVARLREVHLEMMDAVLSGDGLERVADLAAGAAGAPVAIVVPRLGATASGGGVVPARVLESIGRYVVDRLRDRPAEVPD